MTQVLKQGNNVIVRGTDKCSDNQSVKKGRLELCHRIYRSNGKDNTAGSEYPDRGEMDTQCWERPDA